MRMLRLTLILFLLPLLHAQQAPIELIAAENSVEKSANGRAWSAAKTGDRLNYGMHVRTGEYSRAALRFPSGNVIRLSEFSNMRIARPKQKPGEQASKTQLKKGAMHFFSISEEHTFAFGVNALTSHVIHAQYNVL